MLDTNALLEPYRYGMGAREAALNSLEAVRDRLWMPHQVGVEFFQHHEHNRSELSRAYDKALAVLTKAQKEIRGAFGDNRNFQESRQAVEAKVERSFRGLKRRLGELREDDPAIDDEDHDAVLHRLTALYADRLGRKPGLSMTRKRVDDFHSWRVPNQIPPGFADAGEKETPAQDAGDYLIWEEVLEYATKSAADVLIVTNDLKIDWWEKPPGERPRPRRELVEEFSERTGRKYHQMTLREFITAVEDVYDVDVDDAAVDEITEMEARDARRQALARRHRFDEDQRDRQVTDAWAKILANDPNLSSRRAANIRHELAHAMANQDEDLLSGSFLARMGILPRDAVDLFDTIDTSVRDEALQKRIARLEEKYGRLLPEGSDTAQDRDGDADTDGTPS